MGSTGGVVTVTAGRDSDNLCRLGVITALSSKSMPPVLNLTPLDGDFGGVSTLSSGSLDSCTERAGSEAATTDEASLSPDSLITSSVVFALLRLTTRFFFFRMPWARWRPAPSERPVVADCTLTRDGRDGREFPSSELRLLNV